MLALPRWRTCVPWPQSCAGCAWSTSTPPRTAEGSLLRSLAPLLQDLVLPLDDEFFRITKQFHNWLQGQSRKIGTDQQRHKA
jgi:hypothetical protein